MALKTMHELFGADKERTPTPLKHLLRLPSTAEIIEAEKSSQRQDINERQPPPDTLERYHRRLEDAARRDAIQATRPEGCWCLGLGGTDECVGGLEGERIFNRTCSCPEGLAAAVYKDTILRAKSELLIRARIETVWENAQIPARFCDWRLETSPWLLAHPDVLPKLTDRDERGIQSWFVYGLYGGGKTGIAVGIARRRIVDDETIETLCFVSGPRLFSQLRSTYNRDSGETEQDVIDRYAKADLLILDDIGAEQVKNQDWLADRLYQIVGERHDELRPTIFTSNLSMDQLAKRIGERVTWRIVEMVGVNIIHVAGPNLRA